ncbi:MAG: hypothetical protein AAGA31_11990 [Bacteroidota bacterium]
MLGKNQLLEQLGESYGYVSAMMDRKVEGYKLSAAEKSAKAASGFITGIIIASIGGVFSIFALLTLAFFLADMAQATYGFGIVTLILFAVLALIIIFRRVLIVNPTVSKVIQLFFAEDEKPASHE